MENTHVYESGHVASGHFVLGRDVLCEFDYYLLAIGNKYASNKVCPQLKLLKLVSELCIKLHGQEQNNAHGKHDSLETVINF